MVVNFKSSTNRPTKIRKTRGPHITTDDYKVNPETTKPAMRGGGVAYLATIKSSAGVLVD